MSETQQQQNSEAGDAPTMSTGRGEPMKPESDWANDWMFSSLDDHFVETLKQRIPKEIGCAFATSVMISPLVGIIDKCIVQDISGAPKFMTAVGKACRELVFTPSRFYGSLAFRLTVGVYFGTYAIANLAEAAMTARKIRGYHKRKSIKVAAASVANISLLSWRDLIFAQQFSSSVMTTTATLSSSPPSSSVGGTIVPSTPLRSLGLFMVRDAGTMYATFYLAPRVAQYMRSKFGVEKNTAEITSALGVPMLAQFVTAPLHIHAMHSYQVPTASRQEQWKIVKQEFWTVSLARSVRILPAFGLGSYLNNKIRDLFIRSEDENRLLTKKITRFLQDKKPLNPKLTRRLTQLLDGERSSRSSAEKKE